MNRLKKEIEEFKLECEWKQMIPSIHVIWHLEIWLKRLDELDEGKRAAFAKLLDDKRKEYESIVGKKPFMGWDYNVIDSKIDEYVDAMTNTKVDEPIKKTEDKVDVGDVPTETERDTKVWFVNKAKAIKKPLPPKKKVVWKKK